jgi:hypothetical protein
MSNKPKVVKDYEKVSEEVLEQIKLNYPRGFRKNLITFKNAKGQFVSALPFETEDRYYLIRMTVSEAVEIIKNDDDYNDDGTLKKKIRDAYEDKYNDDEDEDEDYDDGEDEIEEITIDDIADEMAGDMPDDDFM